MIRIIRGNIFDYTKGYIVHQCNCSGGFGAGMAGQVRTLYPEVANAYYKLYKESVDPRKTMLGSIQIVKTNRHPDLSIVNLFGQYQFRRERGDNTRYTDYEAFEQAARKLLKEVPKHANIYFPLGIGCGNANGSWPRVYKILNKVFKDDTHRVFIISLP